MANQDRESILKETSGQVRVCTKCRLHMGRTYAVPGEGPSDADVFLIGEAPGRAEDASGRPFVGAAGKILDKALAAARIPRKSAFITNVVKCRPPSNRSPRAAEREACRPYLMTQIGAVRPKVLVTLGATALQALLDEGPQLKIAHGHTLSFGGIPLVPTYHPAAVLYDRRLARSLHADLRKAARLPRSKAVRIRSGPPRKGKRVRPTRSSGAVVVGPDGRILLLRRSDEAIWCLPKGTVESGETLEEAAIREVYEETGFNVRLVWPIAEIRYSFYWPPDRVNYEKTVMYFRAEPVGGRLNPEPGFDTARWVSHAEAIRLLHWKNDKQVVTKAFESIERSAP